MFVQQIITTTDTKVLQIIEGNEYFLKELRDSSHLFWSELKQKLFSHLFIKGYIII